MKHLFSMPTWLNFYFVLGTFDLQSISIRSNSSTGEVCFCCEYITGASSNKGCAIQYNYEVDGMDIDGNFNIIYKNCSCEKLFNTSNPVNDEDELIDNGVEFVPFTREYTVIVFDMNDGVLYDAAPAYTTVATFIGMTTSLASQIPTHVTSSGSEISSTSSGSEISSTSSGSEISSTSSGSEITSTSSGSEITSISTPTSKYHSLSFTAVGSLVIALIITDVPPSDGSGDKVTVIVIATLIPGSK